MLPQKIDDSQRCNAQVYSWDKVFENHQITSVVIWSKSRRWRRIRSSWLHMTNIWEKERAGPFQSFFFVTHMATVRQLTNQICISYTFAFLSFTNRNRLCASETQLQRKFWILSLKLTSFSNYRISLDHWRVRFTATLRMHFPCQRRELWRSTLIVLQCIISHFVWSQCSCRP